MHDSHRKSRDFCDLHFSIIINFAGIAYSKTCFARTSFPITKNDRGAEVVTKNKKYFVQTSGIQKRSEVDFGVANGIVEGMI